jgi:histidyl-tRNA synthetase
LLGRSGAGRFGFERRHDVTNPAAAAASTADGPAALEPRQQRFEPLVSEEFRKRLLGNALHYQLLERLIINLKRQEVAVPPTPAPQLYVAHLTPEAAVLALRLAELTRGAGCQTMMGSAGRSLKAQLRHANARDARYVAIIGADEAAKGEVTLRDLRDHGERRVPIEDVAPLIAE